MNSGPNVDWRYAGAVARRIGGSGPTIGREGAHQAVEELRAGAAVAVDVVRAATGLHADVPADGVRVVDRPRWIDANVAAFETVIAPITEKLARSGRRDSAMVSVTSRLAGAEVGAALGFMSSRVLGQYELFTTKDAEPQLLLVAPNIVEVEHRLAVNSSDFRLWVCLHEETHRVQFTAVPWLGPWLRARSVRHWTTCPLTLVTSGAGCGRCLRPSSAHFVVWTSSRHSSSSCRTMNALCSTGSLR